MCGTAAVCVACAQLPACARGCIEFVTTDISEDHTVTVISVGLSMCSRVNKAANVIVAFCRGLCYAIGTTTVCDVCSDGSATFTVRFHICMCLKSVQYQYYLCICSKVNKNSSILGLKCNIFVRASGAIKTGDRLAAGEARCVHSRPACPVVVR